MFIKTKKQIALQGKTEDVIRFEVWFSTPFGLFQDYQEALMKIIANDMDPELCLSPRSVAITESSYEVVG